MIVWPEPSYGIVAYVTQGEANEPNEFLCAWPVTTSGLVYPLDVKAVTQDPDASAIRTYGAEIYGVPVCIFDTFCEGAGLGIKSSTQIFGRLHGWAYMLERPQSTSFEILAADASKDLRRVSPDVFAADGKLVVRADEISALLTLDDGGAPIHEIAGIVKHVRAGPALLGAKLYILTVTVARPEEGPDEIDLEISVPSTVWEGPEPMVGEMVNGLIWLQATFENAPAFS